MTTMWRCFGGVSWARIPRHPRFGRAEGGLGGVWIESMTTAGAPFADPANRLELDFGGAIPAH
jgi:hypothetical protein